MLWPLCLWWTSLHICHNQLWLLLLVHKSGNPAWESKQLWVNKTCLQQSNFSALTLTDSCYGKVTRANPRRQSLQEKNTPSPFCKCFVLLFYLPPWGVFLLFFLQPSWAHRCFNYQGKRADYSSHMSPFYINKDCRWPIAVSWDCQQSHWHWSCRAR